MQIKQNPDYNSVVTLLAACHLPTQDITVDKLSSFLGYYDDTTLIGVVGMEFYGDFGLLRSLAVAGQHRNSGIANHLLSAIEEYAVSKRIKYAYLLTTTASAYFIKHGFTLVSRDNVPDAIKNTSEFDSICPKSATLMYKELAW